MFVDRATIFIESGKGGDGAVSFRREAYVPEGGPDGGDGGKGGDVIFQADHNMRTLMDFRYQRKYKARDGQNGMKKNRFGAAGKDMIIKVPAGTLLLDEESGQVIHDLRTSGETFTAARGGKGGKGNVHFKSSVRQAPHFAEAGGEAQSRTITLELKLIADVGLVGFPNVGKSTLLSVCSKAKPKIADYHFTTIQPNLGVVQIGESSFVMADIAGLIEGASDGAGMGTQFLKHVERTRILIHVVDASGCEGRDPVKDFDIINRELARYSKKLVQKPQIVAAAKMDMVDEEGEEYRRLVDYIRGAGYEIFPISAPIGYGVNELMQAAAQLLENTPEEPLIDEPPSFEEEGDPDYRMVIAGQEGDVYTLKGRQLDKIFRSTNFNDMGSLRYLYQYIERSGALEQLRKLGLEEGDTIRINDMELEYMEEFT